MSIRKIIEKGDATLTKRSHPVTNFDKKLHDLLDDMRATLIESGGLGLAAPQIGILRRIALVMDDEGNIFELINPEILEREGEQEGFEGCLSLPGLYGIVVRPNKVKVRAFDRNGKEFTTEGEGMTARCFCHELEHLDGHMFDEHTDQLYTEKELDQMSKKRRNRG